MFGSRSSLAAGAWLLLLLLNSSVASAVPAAAPIDADAVPEPSSINVEAVSQTVSPQSSQSAEFTLSPSATEPWVKVDENGKPKTVTPVFTTIDGTPTVVSAAPHAITATVFTKTAHGEIRTSTGAPPPKATNKKNGSGAFGVCKNLDGEFKPFCEPADKKTLNPGGVYYITWDPTFFHGANTTVKVVGFYNADGTDQAFSSDAMSAGWGFYQWHVNKDLMRGNDPQEGANITISITALTVAPGANATANAARWHVGPRVRVASPPKPKPHKTPKPDDAAVYVGLPIVVSFVALMLIGTCIANRRARRIGLGNIVSRSRLAVAKSKSRSYLGKKAGRRIKEQQDHEQSIRLMDRNGSSYDEEDVLYEADDYRRRDKERIN